MTHAQLIAALFPDGKPADYKAHALLLGQTAMQAAQDAVGSERHKVQPVATTGGRFVNAGGFAAAAMDHFDGTHLAGVEVLPWADGAALLPLPDDEDLI